MFVIRLNKKNDVLKEYANERTAFKDAYAYVKKNPSKSFTMNIYRTEKDYEKENALLSAFAAYMFVDGTNKICISGLGSFQPNILNPDGTLGTKVKSAPVTTPRGRFLGEVKYTAKPYPKKYMARTAKFEKIGPKAFVGNEKVVEGGDYEWLYLSDKLKSRTRKK